MKTIEERAEFAGRRYEMLQKDQAEQAFTLLASGDYSAAATACHRALQFERQAEAVRQLVQDPVTAVARWDKNTDQLALTVDIADRHFYAAMAGWMAREETPGDIESHLENIVRSSIAERHPDLLVEIDWNGWRDAR